MLKLQLFDLNLNMKQLVLGQESYRTKIQQHRQPQGQGTFPIRSRFVIFPRGCYQIALYVEGGQS